MASSRPWNSRISHTRRAAPTRTSSAPAGWKRLGGKKWRRAVKEVVAQLSTLLEADYVVIGGGNARKLKRLPKNARLGSNDFAFLGGFRIWHHAAVVQPAAGKWLPAQYCRALTVTAGSGSRRPVTAFAISR